MDRPFCLEKTKRFWWSVFLWWRCMVQDSIEQQHSSLEMNPWFKQAQESLYTSTICITSKQTTISTIPFSFFGYLFSEIHRCMISWGAFGGVCLVADQAVTATTAETMSFTGCSLVGSHKKHRHFFSHFFWVSFFLIGTFLKSWWFGNRKLHFGAFLFTKRSMVIMGFLCKSSRTWWDFHHFPAPHWRFFEDLIVDLAEVLETTYKAFIYVEDICRLMLSSFIAPFFCLLVMYGRYKWTWTPWRWQCLILSRMETALAMVSSALQLMCCPQPRLLRLWGISTKNGIFRGPEMHLFLSATFFVSLYWGDLADFCCWTPPKKKWKTWTYNSNNSERSNILMLSMSTYSGIEFWTS